MAEEKKAKIVGEISLEGKAKGELREILDEMKKFRNDWALSTASIGKAEKATKQVTEETRRASKEGGLLANVWRGIWQGVGQKLFSSVVDGIGAMIRSLAAGVNRADEFGDAFERMSARGIADANELLGQTAELAVKLGADLLTTTQAVEESRKAWNTNADAVAVAETALKNYYVTGMDVRESIQSSAEVIRVWGMAASEQAGVIDRVATMSRRYSVAQSDLYMMMARVAPMLRGLNVTFRDLTQTLESGLSRGMRTGRMGLTGFLEVIQAVYQPSDDLKKALIDMEAISPRAEKAWRAQGAAVGAMRQEMVGLNSELRALTESTRALTELNEDVKTSMARYSELQAKKAQGERLNRFERQELRELTRALEAQNRELSRYDRSARFVADLEFKRKETLEQLGERLKGTTRLQEEWTRETERAAAAAKRQEEALKASELVLKGLGASALAGVQGEIERIVSERGLGGLIEMLSGSEAAINTFSGMSQAWLQQVSGNASQAAGSIAGLQGEVVGVSQQFDAMLDSGYDAFEKRVSRFDVLKTLFLKPFADLRDRIASLMGGWMEAPGADGLTPVQRAEQWATETSGKFLTTAEQLFRGDITFKTALEQWWTDAMEVLKPAWDNWIEPAVKKMKERFASEWPGLQTELEILAYDLGKVVGQAILVGMKDALVGLETTLLEKISGPVRNTFQSITDIFYGVAQGNPNANLAPYAPPFGGFMAAGSIVTRPTMVVAGEAGPEAILPLSRRSEVGDALAASGMFGGYSGPQIVVNGAADPQRVADEVVGIIERNRRLGGWK